MFLKELPPCSSRFGRIDHESHKAHIACGYNEVYPEDCIICGGFTKTKIKLKVETFIVNNKRSNNINLEEWV